MVKNIAVLLLALVVIAYAADTAEPRGVIAGTPDGKGKKDLDTASSFFGGYGLGFGYGLYGGYGGWGGWGIPYGYGYGYRGFGWGWPGYGGYGYGGFYG